MSISERCHHTWLDAQSNGGGDAPDIVVLWDRTSIARKNYRCTCCGEPIEPGSEYRTNGMRLDGVFVHERTHPHAERYPSGCPSIGARDRAELDKQFALDQERYSWPLPSMIKKLERGA